MYKLLSIINNLYASSNASNAADNIVANIRAYGIAHRAELLKIYKERKTKKSQ